jgi:hypothetical protein
MLNGVAQSAMNALYFSRVPAGAKHEKWAAVRIQAAFRGYLVRFSPRFFGS